MDENFSMVDALSNLASVALVIGATMPPLLLLLLPVFLASLGVGRVYVKSARELKRLESTLKSPIYSNFAATIEGVATVRAFAGAGARVSRATARSMDAQTHAEFALWICNRCARALVRARARGVARARSLLSTCLKPVPDAPGRWLVIRTQALSACVALGVAASLIALAAGALGGAVDDDA